MTTESRETENHRSFAEKPMTESRDSSNNHSFAEGPMTENNGSKGETQVQVVSVPFRDDQVQAVQDIKTGKVSVVIKRICENIGVDTAGQVQRLKTCAWAVAELSLLPDSQGLVRPTWLISLDRLAMWLANIQVRRCRPEIRERLIAYQAECADVLDRHFRGGPKPAPEPAPFDVEQFAQVMGREIANHLAPLHKTQTVLMADNARIHERVSKHDADIKEMKDDLVRIQSEHPMGTRDRQSHVPPRGPQPRGPQPHVEPRVEPRRRDENFDSWLTVWEYCKPRGIPFDGDTLRAQSGKIGALAKSLGHPSMVRYIPELRARRKIYPLTVLHEFYGSPRERTYRAGFDFTRRSASPRGGVEVDNGAAEL